MEYHTISDGYRFRNLKVFKVMTAKQTQNVPTHWLVIQLTGESGGQIRGNPMNCLGYGCKCNSFGPDCGARRQQHKDGTPKDTTQTLFCGPIDGLCLILYNFDNYKESNRILFFEYFQITT